MPARFGQAGLTRSVLYSTGQRQRPPYSACAMNRLRGCDCCPDLFAVPTQCRNAKPAAAVNIPPPATVVARRDRVNCLREFILEHYSLERLRSGPVLDVAGGKGDLAWLLRNVDGVDAVVVDPRLTDHSKLTRTAQWYADNPIAARAQAAAGSGGTDGQALARLAPMLTPPWQIPRHLQTFLDADLLGALAASTRTGTPGDAGPDPTPEAGWAEFWAAASRRADNEVGSKGHHQPAGWIGSGASGRVTDAATARTLFTSSTLVVGFHPDQATEPCVDLALANRVPFVVCPCCTFPAHFPDRSGAFNPINCLLSLPRRWDVLI